MKIALVTDQHIGARADSQVFNQYFWRFFEEIFFPHLEQHNITTIVHLGDLFDRRKYINFQTLNFWRNNFFERLNKNYKTYILQGNHDIYYKDTNRVNSLTELLSQYENVQIIDKSKTIKFNGTEILCVPWVVPDQISDAKVILNQTKAEVVFGHFDIMGFQMYPGYFNTVEGFDVDDFERFDLVCSGHYHQKSTNGENIFYLGAPYEIVWSDCGEDRGFHIFDTNTRELEFIKNPFQIFHKVVYNDTNKTYEDLVVQKEILKKDQSGATHKVHVNNLSKYKDCYVKIIIEQKSNQYLFDQFLEAIYRENPADISIVESMADLSIKDELVDETKDTLTLLVEYAESLKIDETNKIPLVELLKTLYFESLNMET